MWPLKHASEDRGVLPLPLASPHLLRSSLPTLEGDRLCSAMMDYLKDLFNSQVIELRKLWKNKRNLLFQALNLAMIVFSALM